MSKGVFTFLSRSHLDRSNHSNISRSDFAAKEPQREKRPVCSVCRYSCSGWRDVPGRHCEPGSSCEHSPLWNDTFRPPLNVAPKLHKSSTSDGACRRVLNPSSSAVGRPSPSVLRLGKHQQRASTLPATLNSLCARTRNLWKCPKEEQSFPAPVEMSRAMQHKVDSRTLLRTADRNTNTPRQCSGAEGKPFQIHFPPINKQKEKTKRAREARNVFEGYPYHNPTPYSHRQLLPGLKDVVTSKTPDPMDLRFKREAITIPEETSIASWEENQSDLSPSDRRATGETRRFATHLPPAEPPFRADLYLPKGRYSPAFSAYEAYLDRVVDSVRERQTLN